MRGTVLQTPRAGQKEGQELLRVPELIPLRFCGAAHREAAEPLQPLEVPMPEQGDV